MGVEAGWITEPIDISESILRKAPIDPRYAISEQHGNRPKILD